MSSLLSLQEENRILQQELSRVEDLLAQSRAERDELAIKYNAISERVSPNSPKPPFETPQLTAIQAGIFAFPMLGAGGAVASMGIPVPACPDLSWLARACPVGCTKHPHPCFVFGKQDPLPWASFTSLHRGDGGIQKGFRQWADAECGSWGDPNRGAARILGESPSVCAWLSIKYPKY